MKFYETDEFKNQQKEWYQKLRDSGFKDIETIIGNDQKLLQYSKSFDDTEKTSYYQTLMRHIYTEIFDDSVDGFIVLMRAHGIKIKDIAAQLRAWDLHRSHRETIRYIIRKYEVRWGIRSYKPSQLSSKRG